MLPLKVSDVYFLVNLYFYSSAQTFPYVSFRGQTLANHSYVNLSLVRNDNSVQCHTDLSTCCSRKQGPHRGDWYFPNGTRLPFPPGHGNSYENRDNQSVDLYRGDQNKYGIYRCDISTLAVHDDDDSSVRDTVYVGLYNHSGG